jgi:hypothetical protein
MRIVTSSTGTDDGNLYGDPYAVDVVPTVGARVSTSIGKRMGLAPSRRAGLRVHGARSVDRDDDGVAS